MELILRTAIIPTIASELQLDEASCRNALQLLVGEECTIPFVARYRKERTGSMDELQLLALIERYQYLDSFEQTREKYLKVLDAIAEGNPELASKMPELRQRFMACQTKAELEDLYLPFKPKKRTRARIALEKGLGKLVDRILVDRKSVSDLAELAQEFVTSDPELPEDRQVASAKDALRGACDILAEQICETPKYRQIARDVSFETAMLTASKNEKKIAELPENKLRNLDKYTNYFDYREKAETAPSHRVLAIWRGESEGFIRVRLEVDSDRILQSIAGEFIQPDDTEAVRDWLNEALGQSYRRMISPAIETELRNNIRQRAEEEATKVFATNLEKLLMQAPIPQAATLGVDPGFRTGCKLAALSETGKYLESAVIYPDYDKPDSPASKKAEETVLKLVKDHSITYIAVGNGTGGREIDLFLSKLIKRDELTVKKYTVNEAGASVYSTDEIAISEFPELDPTIRSAVSIGRRLQDPLAELVKIDPKSVGVGQYQHDCDQRRLTQILKTTVESCVNKVGVNLNSASFKLLSYVSGISQSLAKRIVEFREQSGRFNSRAELTEVSGFGPKSFEQAAGFLRIVDGSSKLDSSAVHPESYAIVEMIAKDMGTTVDELIGNTELVATIRLDKYVDDSIGLPSLMDISSELTQPGRDPRQHGARIDFSDEIMSIKDLKVGMRIKGTVSNVTNFGAFVDLGIHQDGLVHLSELSDEFVSDPYKIVAVGDTVNVQVIGIDLEKSRISLSCKAKREPQAGGRRETNGSGANGKDHRRGGRNQARRSDKGRKPERAPAANFSVDDLMKKFNAKF